MNAVAAYPKPTRCLLEDWLDARKAKRQRELAERRERNEAAAMKRKRRS